MAEVFITNSEGYTGQATRNLKRARPLEMASRSEAIAPAGCPIMSQIFVVDKNDVAICDGEDRWYMYVDKEVKHVEAGQPFSDLYT